MESTHNAADPSESTTGEELAVLDQVHKTYQVGSTPLHALGGVDLAICQGSYWSIMGPSGSGKSTLLNLLGCMDRPTKGSYTLAGANVGTLDDDALSELRLHTIGFIFQSFNLIKQLTVRENIELPLFYQGWRTDKSSVRAAELAHRVGLGRRLNHRPYELSGGEQQRVAIARSLANNPQLILADEPTGKLDSKTGRGIMELITELNEQGKTIVMVTHDANIAAHASVRLHMLDGVVDHIERDS